MWQVPLVSHRNYRIRRRNICRARHLHTAVTAHRHKSSVPTILSLYARGILSVLACQFSVQARERGGVVASGIFLMAGGESYRPARQGPSTNKLQFMTED